MDLMEQIQEDMNKIRLNKRNKRSAIINNRPVIINNRPVIINNRPVIINNRPVIINNRPVIINNSIYAGNDGLYNLYHAFNTFIHGEISDTRHRNYNSEIAIIDLIKSNNEAEFKKMNFVISHTIVLYPRLMEYIVSLYGINKVENDIIASLLQFNKNKSYGTEISYISNDYYARRIAENFVRSLLAIGFDKLYLWYSQKRIDEKTITPFLKLKNMEYLLH
jgi:hypothetical protein